jgi:hypothetical protein
MAVNEIAVGHVGAGKVAQAAEMRGTPVRSADNFQRAASCRHLAEQVCVAEQPQCCQCGQLAKISGAGRQAG